MEYDRKDVKFAFTIMGTAKLNKTSVSEKDMEDFETFYRSQIEEIQGILNKAPGGGIVINSYLSDFRLDSAIGQVQENHE